MKTSKLVMMINNDDTDTALMLMTERQLNTLVNRKVLNDDEYSRYQDAQEEMRCLVANAQEEFGL